MWPRHPERLEFRWYAPRQLRPQANLRLPIRVRFVANGGVGCDLRQSIAFLLGDTAPRMLGQP